jgi:uncharacterized membrane protein YphA (DoxX/SURF4 family)
MAALEVARWAMGSVFVAHGALFVAPPESVRARMAEQPLSIAGFRRLGVAEALGGLAVLAPLATTDRTIDAVAKLGALGLFAVMVPATLLHLRRSEWATAAGTVAIGGILATLVAG